MSYRVWIDPAAIAETDSVPGHMRQILKRAMKALASDPRPSDSKELDWPPERFQPRRIKIRNYRTPISLYSVLASTLTFSATCRAISPTLTIDQSGWSVVQKDLRLDVIHRSRSRKRAMKAPPAALTPRGWSRKNVLGHAETGGRDPDRWPPGRAAGYRSDTTRSGLPRRWRKCPPLRPRT
jgi:hypothetical protein